MLGQGRGHHGGHSPHTPHTPHALPTSFAAKDRLLPLQVDLGAVASPAITMAKIHGQGSECLTTIAQAL